MLCCVQSGQTALWWAATRGDVDIVQMLVDHGAAVDLGRDGVSNHDYLLTCG
jgi:ankyrin repeat protein